LRSFAKQKYTLTNNIKSVRDELHESVVVVFPIKPIPLQKGRKAKGLDGLRKIAGLPKETSLLHARFFLAVD
jgi:hypothetical protein